MPSEDSPGPAMPDAEANHPAAEQLRAFSLGQVSDAELACVYAHLAACRTCCAVLDQLAAQDHLLSRLQEAATLPEAVPEDAPQRRAAARVLRQGLLRGPAEQTPPRQIGEDDILGEVGRGGMGVVYKARHRGLHRLVALKMVLAGQFASPAQRLRFQLEAELAARVQHPNIVHVY